MIRKISRYNNFFSSKSFTIKKKNESFYNYKLENKIRKFNRYYSQKLPIHESIEKSLKEKFNVESLEVIDTSGLLFKIFKNSFINLMLKI